MYKVSWTSSGELLEEIQNILKNFLQTNGMNINKLISEQIENILKTIEKIV